MLTITPVFLHFTGKIPCNYYMFAQYAFDFKNRKKTEEKNVNITVPTNKRRLIQIKDKMSQELMFPLDFLYSILSF